MAHKDICPEGTCRAEESLGGKCVGFCERARPEPSVREMLEVGEACGLHLLTEAWGNYMNHYDCFFYIPDYAKQHAEFIAQLVRVGLLERVAYKHYRIIDLTIPQALTLLNDYEARNDSNNSD